MSSESRPKPRFDPSKLIYTDVRNIDDVFQLDSYQLVVLLFNEFLIFTMLSNVVFNMFGTAAPKITGCDLIAYNSSSDACSIYNNHLDCKQPMLEYDFKSVPVEFNELCSRNSPEPPYMLYVRKLFGVENRAKLSTIAQMIGIMVGSAVAGQLSDIYGRKRVTLAVLCLILTFSTLSSFSPSIDWSVVVRFFIGICCGGLSTVGQIFVVENLPAAHRFWISTIITWAPNYILFAVFAYYSGDWRTLSRASNVMTVFAILFCAFLLPESTKYLVQTRQKKAAIDAIKYVNKFKRVRHQLRNREIEKVVVDAIEKEEKARTKTKKYNFAHLYSHPRIAIQTLVTSLSMFSVSYVTYGLLFNYDALTGSIYMNAAISGLLRYVIGALVAVLDHLGGDRIGRKRMHFITVSFIMICMFSIFYIYVNDLVRVYRNWIRALTLIAFGTTGCLFLQILLVTAEMFPTGIRNIASAHINVCGRLGNVFGPMVFSYNLGFTGSGYLILAIICLIDVTLFQLFLPETKNQPLPTEMPTRRKNQSVEKNERQRDALMTIQEEA